MEKEKIFGNNQRISFILQKQNMCVIQHCNKSNTEIFKEVSSQIKHTPVR